MADITAYGTTSESKATYLRGNGLVYAKIGDSGHYFYQKNAHGDVVQYLNSNGPPDHTYKYNAFGVELSSEGPAKNSFRYCGEYFDAENGSIYLRARHYVPGVGRFTQEDTHWNPGNMVYGDSPLKVGARKDLFGSTIITYAPLLSAIKQSENLYAYCGSNPLIYVDSNGEVFMLVTGALGALAGAIGGAIYSYAKYGEVRLKNVAAGAAIGGAIGLTGGAAVAAVATGSATATTTLVGIRAAQMAGGAAVAGTATSTRVIGSFPEYVARAEQVGTKFFQIPTNIWINMSPTQQWAANQKFLDRAISQGAHFLLVSSKKLSEYGPYLQKEITYLLKHGYKFVENGMKLVPK